MTAPALLVLALHVLIFAGLFVYDRWRGLNRFADWIESDMFPSWLRWERWGDPVTWLHHTLVSSVFTAYSAGWGLVLPDGWLVGARVGAGFALAFYGLREGYGLWRAFREQHPGMFWRGAPHYTGWLVDGTMDVAGALLINVWLWK